MLFYIHPLLQATGTTLALYTLYLGSQRALTNHFGQKRIFAWGRHVLMGRLAMSVWLVGLLVGLVVARTQWGAFGVTGAHAYGAMLFVPLVLFGACTGYIMDKDKKKRQWLPLAHGICNTLLVCLAVLQGIGGRALLP